ncbi:MAG: hypothetical protein Q9M36_05605 [Sulfurovum sp.]|nr:hypothetical protein [Sulfurovum sp.]
MTQDLEYLKKENNEHNLKLHYEALRKELDIVLTSSIPQQLANMKTLLWVNFIMIGLILQTIKKFPLPTLLYAFSLLHIGNSYSHHSNAYQSN